MDPAHVDMRTFYPYQPNEVKHRRRTTRAQLKVLEDVYTRDTKPNASLRKKLAQELDMTPRGVQVWFQNRRAKTKQQRKKAEAASLNGGAQQQSLPDQQGDNADLTSPPASPTEDQFPEEASPEPPQASPAVETARPKPDSAWNPPHSVQLYTSPGHLAPPDADLYSLRRPSLPALVNGSLAAPDVYGIGVHGLQRRGFDPTTRRRSIDTTNALRLVGHPYAHAVSVANNGSPSQGLYGDSALGQVHEDGVPSWLGAPQLQYGHRRQALAPRLSVPFLHPHHHPSQPQPQAAPHPQPVAGNGNQHAGAIQGAIADRSPPPPNIAQALTPRRSGDASNAPGTLVHPAAAHARMSAGSAAHIMRHQHRSYALSARVLAAPPPGPLPTPNFSFGDGAGSQGPSPPEASPASSANSSTVNLHAPDGNEDHAHGSELAYREAGRDEEESEYSAISRFGSIASVGGSESSWTSAGSGALGMTVGGVAVSLDVGNAPQGEWKPDWDFANAGPWKDGFQYGGRRDSCASGQFLELFNGLEVDSTHESPVPPHIIHPHGNQASHNLSQHHSGEQGPPDSLASGVNGMETRQIPEQYPSPTSTISAGTHHSPGYDPADQNSPHVQNMGHSNHVDVYQDAHSKGYGDAVHARNSSSELAYALQGHPEDLSRSQSQSSQDLNADNSQLQYPADFTGADPAGLDGASDATASSSEYGYSQQSQESSAYASAYDGSATALPYPGTPIYDQNAIQLSHMCVPASVAGGQYLALGYSQFP
ncbi:hypothetical protein CERSUDRAFT_94820 [Gelatoporia subvermispora B]|uniref:Homeobox domain-containing protein n=1 Tax=Ceriporiopsis subvermispora (strain B) TaxID=914234 RepID=M2QLB2_CERS8|nr:hypothetical protein CERSUDRAFT_94820 [Gelatoporia subvermispora B]